MSPDDPRHGTRRGYYAHRKDGESACDPCKRAAARYVAELQLRTMRGIPGRIPAYRTQRRLQALVALGYTWSYMDRWLGRRMSEKFGSGRLQYVLPRTHERVCALYDELHMRPAPRSTRLERINYAKAMNMARRNNWPPPLAWDDIDNPDEHPADWHYQPGDRGELLEELDARKVGISEVCRVLGLRRDTVEKWCERHGYNALYSRLVAREITNPASPFTGNQHRHPDRLETA